MSKRNSSVLWTIGNQGLSGSERSNARKNIGVNFSNPSDPSDSDLSLVFLSGINNQDGTAKDITFTKKKVLVDGDTYDPTSKNPASSQTIKRAIETLDVAEVALNPNQTLSTLSETDGKISATFQDIEATWVDNTNQWLKMLYVTSKTSVSELSAGKFASGLSNIYVATGHNYLSVNCGEGIYIDNRITEDTFGKLRLYPAGADQLGGVKLGYTETTDNFALKTDSSGHSYVTVPLSDIETEISNLRIFSSVSVNPGASSGAFTVSPTNNHSTLKLTSDSNIVLSKPSGTTDTIQFSYTLPTATSAVLGGVKIGFSSTLTDEKYPVELNSSSQAYVSVGDMFRLTEGIYSSQPTGVRMGLSCSDPTEGASVVIMSRSGAIKSWPSKGSSSTDPVGYLLPAFASGTTGKRLVLDSGHVKWVTDNTEYTAGTDIDISSNNVISVDTTSTVTGKHAFGIGEGCYAVGVTSFAGGAQTEANALRSFAFGANSVVNTHDSVSLGVGNTINGDYSMAIGFNITIPQYTSGAGGVLAIGQNLECSQPGVLYLGSYNSGIAAEEAGCTRITGQGYLKSSTDQHVYRRNIEMLHGDGILETYTGFTTTSYILTGGESNYSTIRSNFIVNARGYRDDSFRSGFPTTEAFYSPILMIDDRYTYRTDVGAVRVNATTMYRDGLNVQDYVERNGSTVESSYIARYNSRYIAFESSAKPPNYIEPGFRRVPAWAGSAQTGTELSDSRLYFMSSDDRFANIKAGTVSIKYFTASELTQTNPLVPSEEPGELTFIYCDTTDEQGRSEFWIYDKYSQTSPGTPGPEKKSGYITANNFCIMMTVEPSNNIGQSGFTPGKFALLTADSEAGSSSAPNFFSNFYGYGNIESFLANFDFLASRCIYAGAGAVLVKDSALPMSPTGRYTGIAYYVGYQVDSGMEGNFHNYKFYFHSCGQTYLCTYDANTPSHSHWEKV